jgi:GH35 family endo-1,4-beta-xylanase
MSNLTPGDLISASEAGSGNSVFYWQEYLGKDYAVTAFNAARQSGNGNEKLFIYDDNLFEKPAKLNGLVEYINYIDGKGATVDGISTPLNVTLGITDVQTVREFFASLAATGKLVRISGLKAGIRREGGSANLSAGSLTSAEQKAMSDFYKEIVAAYFEKVPASQRYGITLNNPVDNADAVGLWSSDYSRKHSYAGFIEGLKQE